MGQESKKKDTRHKEYTQRDGNFKEFLLLSYAKNFLNTKTKVTQENVKQYLKSVGPSFVQYSTEVYKEVVVLNAAA